MILRVLIAVWSEDAPADVLRDEEGGEEGIYDGRPSFWRIGNEAL